MPTADETDPGEDLDALVRRVAPDRWLASRFIEDARARADVIALYAFEHELARAIAVTREPMMAEIRLTWWADAVAEIFEGRAVRRHPVSLALAGAVGRHGLERAAFEAMIQAYYVQPIDQTAAATAAMSLAAEVLGAPGGNVAKAAEAWAMRAPELLDQANCDLTGLPATAFPAVAYATLARVRSSSGIIRRLALLWAVLRGRF